jgi:DNA-binding response OmpR family regulator
MVFKAPLTPYGRDCPGAPSRILVAEGDRETRDLARVHLTTPRITVEIAADGLEAWSLLTSRTFDLALIDLDMPRLDGLGLILRIREQDRHARLPVVVATGRDDLFAIDRAFEIGATTFVTKPFNWRLLSHQLRFVLESSAMAERLAACEDRLVSLGEHHRALVDEVSQRAPELLSRFLDPPALQSPADAERHPADDRRSSSLSRR